MPARLMVFAGQSNAGFHFDPAFGQAAISVFKPLFDGLTGDQAILGGSAGGQTWLGGSSVQRSAVAPGSTAYWWDDPLNQGLSGVPGPCLTAALAWILAHPNRADLAAIVWIQGEQDCFAIGGNPGIASNTANHPYEGRASLAAYRSQLARVLGHFRLALGRPDLPILIAELGRLGSSAGTWVVDEMRRIQHQVAASMPGVEIASVTRDQNLSDAVHLDTAGYAAVAARLARFAAARIGGAGTARLGPRLSRAMLEEDACRLDLEIAHDGGGAVQAGSPVTGIRVEDDNGIRTPSSFEVAGPSLLRARFGSPLRGRIEIRAGYGGADAGPSYPRDDQAPALPLRPEIRRTGLAPANAIRSFWRR